MVCEELPATQRCINPFAGKGVEEIGGVSDQCCAGRPGLAGSRRKRPSRAHGVHTLGSGKQFSDRRTLRYPALEKFGAICSDLRRPRDWNDNGDIRKTIPNVGDAQVSLTVNVHLAKSMHAANVSIVGDERNPPRPAAGAD